jgi:hypothetical protein
MVDTSTSGHVSGISHFRGQCVIGLPGPSLCCLFLFLPHLILADERVFVDKMILSVEKSVYLAWQRHSWHIPSYRYIGNCWRILQVCMNWPR